MTDHSDLPRNLANPASDMCVAAPDLESGAWGAQAPDRCAKFGIGQLVTHRLFDFRGVVFDVDPEFSNTEEWWLAIPESVRPQKDQPFYHLLAENGESCYVAYASEGNLSADETGEPLRHPQTGLIFERFENGRYLPKARLAN